jgi:hypothetical protein
VLELRDMDYVEWQAGQLFSWTCTNQITSWLMCSWRTFGARMSHGQTWIHKTTHSLNLGEATTFPLIVLYVLSHGACTQMSFFPGTPNYSQVGNLEILEIGTSRTLEPITFCAELRLRWGLKQSCSLHQNNYKDIWHVTWMQINQGNS